ncbi:MAG: exocyst complex component exo84 [Peltula sp. TS41687]|nr:MAG: exocyst complex component exo84 [Peltula sp. TS41687]
MRKDARPAISGPKLPAAAVPQQAPIQAPSNKSKSQVSQQRPALGGKTSDLVKRRYSARFTNLPSNFDPTVPPVPPIPPLPTRDGSPQPSAKLAGASGAPEISIDLSALRDPKLQAESYINSILGHASEQQVRDFQAKLQRLRNRTSTDLQQNVYQNRTQFIRISKEAEKLNGEMRTLRNLMSELKGNTNALSQESLGKSLASSEDVESRNTAALKQARRTSVANLESMWNNQLHTLWKNVEGSQKFLPAIPGRHVIRDSPHWVELDAATWKPRRAIHIFLLNDHLLVASRKRKRVDPASESPKQPAMSKLVAERCWPLQDIEITDLAVTSDSVEARNRSAGKESMARAINVRVGPESSTYRNDKQSGGEKSELLLAVRKAIDESYKSIRAEVSKGAKSREGSEEIGVWETNSSRKSRRPESLRASLGRDRLNILIDVDGKQQNMRWVESQIDELDIEIALQRFNEAVDRVEKLRRLASGLKSNAFAQEVILSKIDERAAKLASVITRQLVETPSFLNATQRNVGWLVRLGFEDRAREAYLNARSQTVGKRSRQCIFEGDLPQYIFQLSFVYFTIIRNTVNIYQACFSPLMMSACVKWAKEQVESFNEILTRQLSILDPSSAVWQECMARVQEHATMMTEAGLDFKNLIGISREINSEEGKQDEHPSKASS